MKIIIQPSGSIRVLRGGGWNDDPADARVADRGRSASGFRDDDLGLRLMVVVR